MKKDLRPVHDIVACDVCGRTILKGERTETYLAPGGHRNVVCELCFVRAEHGGWIRESAADQVPARGYRAVERRPFFSRKRRRQEEPLLNGRHSADADTTAPDEGRYELAGGFVEDGEDTDPPAVEGPDAPPRRAAPQRPRPVRAVPTTADVKVRRAVELFNNSEHQRTVAGLTRTLGFPWATATPEASAPSAVTVVVAWELSWYRYRVDLGDAADPVALQDKGDELGDIDESLRQWNARLDQDGMLAMEAVES